jgi:transcriptional/translational regulatory protein YebC/TACO1
MFDRKGQISYAPGVDEDALMEAALEAGADDVVSQEDGSVEVYTSFADFLSVNEALTQAGFKGDEAEVAMIPSLMAPITDVETAQKVLRLIDALEDLDDVQNVYHNAEISDEIMQQLS